MPRLAQAARRIAARIDDRLPHGRRTIEYEGFTLAYSRGNSLVERIERWGAYEQRTIDEISAAVEASESRILVDVGANIGLVSLAVLARVPGSRAYAFEPGPNQRALLEESARRNGLEGRLVVSPLALSDSAGTALFAAHASRHAAGDGLRDTGRSGRTQTITVRTETLDGWWESAGRPPVAVVKLDTEGSELLVLRGAGRMLARCRPILFLEIQDENLRVYPYDAAEVRRHVEVAGYVLEDLGRAEVVARPR